MIVRLPFSIRMPLPKVEVANALFTRSVSTRRPFAKVEVALASTVRTSAMESVEEAERCSATVSMLLIVELADTIMPIVVDGVRKSPLLSPM